MTVSATDAQELDDHLTADLRPEGRLGLVRRYLTGDHPLPYMPRKARQEYKDIAKRSITNWCPLVPDTFAKGLFVDGFRVPRSSDNEASWHHWQDNGMDARQTVAHRGALAYGVSYVLVLPGEDPARPVIRPLSPLRSAAWYLDDDDEFPHIAINRAGKTKAGDELLDVYDDTSVYHFRRPKDGGDLVLDDKEEHRMGVTPFVRFRDRLDGESVGVVRPLMPIQDRINTAAFDIQIAMQYASFRQRWATGLVIPEDEDGNPVEPFASAIDRLWVNESSEAHFGDFAQTELSGHHAAYDSAVKTFAAVAQISPNLLTGDLVNLSADALNALEASTRRKRAEYATIFGEAWELVFRLSAKAAGLPVPDAAAEVRWRDVDGIGLKTEAEGLRTLAADLQVPPRELWDRVPGVTDAELQRWRAAADADPLLAIADEMRRQGADVGAAPTPEVDPATVKAKAEALGVLIRSGVDPEDAAERVGLSGVEFTGAVPVSLRLPQTDAGVLEEA